MEHLICTLTNLKQLHRNNNAGCSWDNGDCCGLTGNPNQHKICKECKCLDCTYKPKKDECSGNVIKKSCGNTYIGECTTVSKELPEFDDYLYLDWLFIR